MLTSDLLLARRIKGKIYPAYLKEKDKAKHLKLIESIINLFESHIGHTWGELDEALNAIYDPSISIKVIKGFIKLLKDRCESDIEAPIPPEEIRQTVFLTSSKHREHLPVKSEFDRDEVLKSASKELGITPQAIEEQMYADLKSEQVIKKFKPLTPLGLYNRYNLSLAQAVLFKATKAVIKVNKATPAQYRMLFHYIKFFRLIHRVKGNTDDGYVITLDGPFSLFKSVQKYGFNMAMFLPALMLLDRWKLEADILWSKRRQESKFYLDSSSGLVSHYRISEQEQIEESDIFSKQFREAESDWHISTDTDIINLKGEGVCIPDFVFTNSKTKAKVYMEVFGYWSRDAVWKRIELLEKSFPHPLILALSKKLRISEKAVGDDLPGQVFVYTTAISVKSILKILDELGEKD
jgi:hypothetical protein